MSCFSHSSSVLHLVTVHNFHQSWKALELQTGALFASGFIELRGDLAHLFWLSECFLDLYPYVFVQDETRTFLQCDSLSYACRFSFLFKGNGWEVQISSNVTIVRGSYISNLVIYLQYFYIFVFANDRKCKQMNMCIYKKVVFRFFL